MRKRTAACYLGCVLALSLAGGAALAGEAEDVAREHSKAGTAAFNLGHWAEAVAEYEAAYRAVQDPVFLYNIGQAHRLAGESGKALVAYKSYLRTAAPDAPNRAQVDKHVEQLEAIAWTPGPAPKPEPRASSRPIDLKPKAPPAEPRAAGSVASKTESSMPKAATPFHRTWWFWTGAAVVVVAGVATAILLSRGEQDPVKGNVDPGVVVVR